MALRPSEPGVVIADPELARWKDEEGGLSFNFLNLDDASAEEKRDIETLIRPPTKPASHRGQGTHHREEEDQEPAPEEKEVGHPAEAEQRTPAPPPSMPHPPLVPQPMTSVPYIPFSTAGHHPAHMPGPPFIQQQQQHGHAGAPTSQQQPNSASFISGPALPPYGFANGFSNVFINNVTANVNVPHYQQQQHQHQQQQQHYQQQQGMLLQQQQQQQQPGSQMPPLPVATTATGGVGMLRPQLPGGMGELNSLFAAMQQQQQQQLHIASSSAGAAPSASAPFPPQPHLLPSSGGPGMPTGHPGYPPFPYFSTGMPNGMMYYPFTQNQTPLMSLPVGSQQQPFPLHQFAMGQQIRHPGPGSALPPMTGVAPVVAKPPAALHPQHQQQVLAPPSPAQLPQPNFGGGGRGEAVKEAVAGRVVDEAIHDEKEEEQQPQQEERHEAESPPQMAEDAPVQQQQPQPAPLAAPPRVAIHAGVGGIQFGDFSPTEVEETLDGSPFAPPPPLAGVDFSKPPPPLRSAPEAAAADRQQRPPQGEPGESRPTLQSQQEEAQQPRTGDEAAAAAAAESGGGSEPKSWASLFHTGGASGAQAEGSPLNKPTARITPYSPADADAIADAYFAATDGASADGATAGGAAAAVASAATGTKPRDAALAGFLKGYALTHKAASFRPRGLTNRSNWCFANAVLQALVGCPPFYNLMRELPLMREPAHVFVDETLDRLNAVWTFFAEFEIMANFPRLNRPKGRKAEDLPAGKPFEAASVLQMLLSNTKDTFKVVEGRQEDAEEFLSFLLNGMNDEMMSVIKAINNSGEDEEEALAAAAAEEASAQMDADREEEDGWKEVGPGNKGVVTRRTSQQITSTPIADIFQGQIRSSVFSSGEPTATLQPFFTLQLDVQADGTTSVSDALAANFATEKLDGFLCSTTGREIAASRSLSLEALPPILVLHLKRFVYDEAAAGCQKVLKHVAVPVDLEVPRELLSAPARVKFGAKAARSFKLFAVVYHNGNEATKGHYVTDVYHTGLSTWLHFDDGLVKPVPEGSVLAQAGNSCPYILFYRRVDTIGPAGGSEKASSAHAAASPQPSAPSSGVSPGAPATIPGAPIPGAAGHKK